MSTANSRDRAEAEAIVRQCLPGAMAAEVGQLVGGLAERPNIRSLPAVVRTMAQSGALGTLLESMRVGERAQVRKQAREVAGQQPACHHGVPGGTASDPGTGLSWLCAQCRAEQRAQGERLPAPEEPAAEAAAPLPATGGVAVPDGSRRLVLTPASEIRPRPVVWGWQDRLPAGEVSLVAGREGIGKSLFLIDLAAKLTRGELPGVFFGQPRAVFYCATEDSWERTIVPRLIAADADLSLIYRVKVERVEMSAGASVAVELVLPADCDLLAGEIKRVEAAMVALDPLMSAVDRTVDTYSDRDMRTVLEPLHQLADESGCMIVGLAHFNKTATDDPLSKIIGSRAFTSVVRAVLAMARDHDAEDGTCVISQVKNNLGRLDLPHLSYVVRSAIVETEEGDADTGRLHFTGESVRGVHDILSESNSRGAKDRTELAQCTAWLEQELTEDRPSKEIAEAAYDMGFSERTLKRARGKLRVRAESRPTGLQGRNEWWMLALSGEGGQGAA